MINFEVAVIHFAEICISFLSCCDTLRNRKGDSFEIESGRVFRYSSVGVQNLIRAVTCDFQQCGISTSVDSAEPVQPHFKLRNSKCCSVSILTVIEYSSDL